jgi:hypothetical protein
MSHFVKHPERDPASGGLTEVSEHVVELPREGRDTGRNQVRVRTNAVCMPSPEKAKESVAS